VGFTNRGRRCTLPPAPRSEGKIVNSRSSLLAKTLKSIPCFRSLKLELTAPSFARSRNNMFANSIEVAFPELFIKVVILELFIKVVIFELVVFEIFIEVVIEIFIAKPIIE
jgi:hypothetical protein